MRALSDCFALTRVINLPDRPDRLREVTQELGRIGVTFTPGKVELLRASRPAEAAGFPGIGVRGCFLSHLAALQQAHVRGVGSVLIVEDDLEFAPTQVAALKRVLRDPLPAGWGILHLGHSEPAQEAPAAPLVEWTGEVRSAHLYAVDGSVLERLVAYLESCLRRPPGDPVGGPMHFDGALTMFRAQNPEVRTFLAQPSLAGQRSSRSDITPNRWDRLPVLQGAMAVARRMRRQLRGSSLRS